MLGHVLLSALLLGLVSSFSHGPPVEKCDLCKVMYPFGHKAVAQLSAAPYEVVVSNASYGNGRSLDVTVRVTSDEFEGAENNFMGIFVQARRKNGTGIESKAFGTFSTNDTQLKVLKCFGMDKSAIGQSNSSLYKTKSFTWTAPRDADRDFVFQATIIQEMRIFWTGVHSAVIKHDASMDIYEPTRDVPDATKDTSGVDAKRASIYSLVLTVALLRNVVF